MNGHDRIGAVRKVCLHETFMSCVIGNSNLYCLGFLGHKRLFLNRELFPAHVLYGAFPRLQGHRIRVKRVVTNAVIYPLARFIIVIPP